MAGFLARSGKGGGTDDIESLQAAMEAAILFHIADAHCTTYNAQQIIHCLDCALRVQNGKGNRKQKEEERKMQRTHTYSHKLT